MSNYLPPQYGGAYSPHDPNHMPYLPPAYPPQYYPQTNTHGGQQQGNATANYNAYGYNQVAPPAFASAPPPVTSMPLFQGWNPDLAPSQSYTPVPQQSSYNGYSAPQQHTQQYGPTSATRESNGWDQQSQSAGTSFVPQNVAEGDYRSSGYAPVYSHNYSTNSHDNQEKHSQDVDHRLPSLLSHTDRPKSAPKCVASTGKA